MEDHIRNVVVLGVISWSMAFVLIRKLLSNRSFGFCNRLVSTMHATLAVSLASLSVEDWSCPVCPLASNSSPKQVLNNSSHNGVLWVCFIQPNKEEEIFQVSMILIFGFMLEQVTCQL